MSKKRQADKQLTRDDLDRLDEEDSHEMTADLHVPQERQVASAEVLSQRKVVRARRSLNTSGVSSSSSPFAGLNLQVPQPSNRSPFAGLQVQQQQQQHPVLFAGLPATSYSLPSSSSTPKRPETTSINMSNGIRDQEEARERDSMYYQKLDELSSSFTHHLTQCYQKGEEIDFSDNCREYIKFVERIQQQFPVKQKTALGFATSTLSSSSFIQSPPAVNLSFGPSSIQAKREEQPVVSTTSFNGGVSTTTTPSGIFSFGPSSSSTTSPSSSFGLPLSQSHPLTVSFPPPPPTANPSFGTGVPVTQTGDPDGEGEYIPPKAEEMNGEEEGAIYSKK